MAFFGKGKDLFKGYLPNLPEVPYLDDKGDVDWDKKYDLDPNK